MRSTSPQTKVSGSASSDVSIKQQDNINEIVSLLCGMPPTRDNTNQVLQRTYCFGDSLQPVAPPSTHTGTLRASPSEDSGVDTMTYFLGLPPTEEMNEVTKVMLKRRSSQSQLQAIRASSMCDVSMPQPSSPLVADTYPPFSAADYDVVSFVAKQFYQVAQRCGQSLHRATHHSPSLASLRNQPQYVAPLPVQEVLPMPEELLGA
jgi:hypothetical protein